MKQKIAKFHFKQNNKIKIKTKNPQKNDKPQTTPLPIMNESKWQRKGNLDDEHENKHRKKSPVGVTDLHDMLLSTLIDKNEIQIES